MNYQILYFLSIYIFKDIKVLREIIHPGYGYTDIGSAINDIMLLKLAEPAILNDFVRPICLPDV